VPLAPRGKVLYAKKGKPAFITLMYESELKENRKSLTKKKSKRKEMICSRSRSEREHITYPAVKVHFILR
jgi:hypothetical protein